MNSKDCDTNEGTVSIGITIPMRIDFEKSWEGKNKKPAQRPIKIEI